MYKLAQPYQKLEEYRDLSSQRKIKVFVS